MFNFVTNKCRNQQLPRTVEKKYNNILVDFKVTVILLIYVPENESLSNVTSQ